MRPLLFARAYLDHSGGCGSSLRNDGVSCQPLGTRCETRMRLARYVLALSSTVLLGLELEYPVDGGTTHEGTMPTSDMRKLFGKVEVGSEQVMHGVFVALDERNVCKRAFIAHKPMTASA